jgi:hypothetical protein
MEKEVQKDIVSVLTKAVFLIKKQDFAALMELSNHTIHSSSILQDKYSIQTAILIYSLSNILERAKQKGQIVPERIIENVNNLTDNVMHNDEQGCDNAIKNIFAEISKIDDKLPWHIQKVIEKAHIVKGSNMFRHGISVGRVASVLGISQWDLMSYIGKTRIIDKEKEVTDFKWRINLTKKLFNIQ